MKMFTKPSTNSRSKIFTFIILALILTGILYLFIIAPVWAVYQTAHATLNHGRNINKAFQTGNFSDLETSVGLMDDSMIKLDQDIHRLDYFKYLPIIRSYYSDVTSLSKSATTLSTAFKKFTEEIRPHAAVLGFQTTDQTEGGEVGLAQFIKASPEIAPSIKNFIINASPALEYLRDLHVEYYPNLNEYPIRDYLSVLRDNVRVYYAHIDDISAVVENLPQLTGAVRPQNYLILFQNDKELRPTGGFITSYANIKVDTGEIKISDAKNIYEVSTDEAFYPPPSPIALYLKQPVWRMRDVNFSPDFFESMEIFHDYWTKKRLPAVDGIVTIDTQFVQALLEFLGPVEVSDYSLDFSTIYNIPPECAEGGTAFTSTNVVCRLEVYAQRITLDQTIRKAVIGDLMEKIFEKVMNTPKEQWFGFYQQVILEIQEKHLLAYSPDPPTQDLIDRFDFGGRIKEFDGDYLHVNDANLAGLKSDMYLKRSASQSYEIADDGSITKKLKLTYENTGNYDGWLNATARNYVRVYVPKGSELIEVAGGSVGVNTYEDLGKTVFDNFLLIPPLEQREIEFTYKLPSNYTNGLKLLIQNQPGVPVVFHELINGDAPQNFELTTDKIIEIDNSSQ
jgi:hypothetical protein